ncbi:hypothetical protein GE061_012878 [Apolygus lucorum]|uniref:Dicer-2 n=1 Tax=Apolygus lucorum TaxID=248454 RepID=A0A8S9XW77_APOLU|nr:hypothetical protein GE061_012878 [Apolygus lucorum]
MGRKLCRSSRRLVIKTKMNEDLKPRDYQVELVDTALKKNGIIFMPTGSGKTYVASLLIRELAKGYLGKKLSQGGKRTFFLVNTVQLVTQQAYCVASQTPHSVGTYSGDMNVDYWSNEKWSAELDSHEVLVMTAQIFLNLVLHAVLKFSEVNLLIMDECHHARNNHAMAQIMNLYKDFPGEKPHILGLTATLLNANCKPHQIDTEIRDLENALCATILTPSDEKVVQKFSTNPIEVVVEYSPGTPGHLVHLILSIHDQLISLTKSMKLPDRNLTPVEIIENAKLLNKKKTWDQHLSNMLRQTTDIYTTLGLNAASKSILALIVRLERVKLHAEETSVVVLLNMFTTRLHYLRKCMEDEMRECPLGLRPVRFATPKLIELLSILKQMKPTDSILVFVELRFTAKVLHYVVEELSKNNESFSHVKCDFIVGNNNNPMNDVREMLFSTKVNQSTLKRFNTKITNVLFASDVIEEGTDIGHCNSVIKFDRMKSFRSYVQSKGRARHKESVYYVFAEDEKAKMTYNSYKYIEGKMTEILRKSIPDTHMGEFVSDPVEPFSPFGPDGPKVTVYSAISLINRYTSLLPQDKFAHLATFWWSRRNSFGETHAILQLPVNSAIKEPIEGPFCKNEVDAKRTAALVACKMLFEAGEFDDQLLPRGYDCDILHDTEIFALWPEREPMSNPKPGTNKRLQLYKVRYPSALFGCLPTPNTKLYLHAFKITPTFESYGNTRLEAFMDHLSSSHDYAMLSSKPFPQLCDFSLYMNIGEVVVSVLENIPTVQLTREEINLASNFQTFLFTEVLSLAKKFLVKDFENQENSYWVVPVITDLKKRSATIDWKTMKKHQSLPEIKPVPSDVREKQKIRGSDYIGKVVVPWYRPGGVPSMRYIVTKVCENLSPSSQFPSETYNTYSDYFQVRYGERVVNSDQPLIEVRAISSKINCIRPRIGYKSASKRKRLEDNFEETLIPELCVLLDFPGDYMLKATILPSLFHRVHHLLLADELRQKIVLETGLGKLKPPGNSWKKLEVDNTCLQDEEEPATQSTVGVSDLLTENMESLQPSTFPWRPEEEPVDIERQLNHVDLLSIIHFNKFVSSSKESFDDLQVRGDLRPVSPKVDPTAPRLAILDVDEKSSYGPQLADMLPVITSMRAADIVNYERLETLGDSFLKFAISLMLFSYYPELNEGKLTQVKGKIVGNRNLYYCGHDLGLGEIIKARDFSPEDWLVPGFTIVSSLKSILVKNKISPHRFYNINLDKEEINSGLLSDESLSQVNEVLNTYLNTDDPEVPSKANNYTLAQLGLQPVADKCIADSVEALLGVYMQTCGLRGAFKLCSYLGVIPNKLADVTFLLDKPPPTALRKPGLPYGDLMKADVIETTLGYRFRDRSFLLQALTHSSSVHFATDCYQRLEFLGDAVLDFLITLYIFDACGKLSPGDLTDLRSALVNNITFSCLAVKYDFHKHLIARSFSLTDIIQSFADRQVKRGHSIGAEVSFLVEESDVSLAESVEVPKVLGDLFESIIGAVYLDSGKCLKTTWDVVYRLMHDVILSFSKNVPKNNIRLLYEKFPNPLPKFGKSRLVEDGRVLVPLEIIHNGPTELERKIFTGMGLTKAAAKLAAAKFALRHFHDKKVE